MSKPEIVFLDSDTIGNDIAWPDFSIFGNVILHAATSPEQTAERLARAEIVLTNKVAITKEHITAAKKLRYIGSLATGYNHVNVAAAAAHGIPVSNVPGYSGPSVMQHVFSLLLALTSRICGLNDSVRNGGWTTSPFSAGWFQPIMELKGKTMGIVGFGDIGRQVGKTAHVFGMKVIASTPRPKPLPPYDPFNFVSFEELLKQADVISLHCPLTPENEGMINARALGMMKKSTYLINTARGQLVNEEDLSLALRRGAIAGAGLDVVSEEPIAETNPLLRTPHCIITPHIAWAGREAKQRLMQGVYDNLKNFMHGRPSNITNGISSENECGLQ